MKTCTVCKQEKPLSLFNKKGAGLQSRCRACQKTYYKNYYESCDKEKARLKVRNEAVRQEIKDYIRKLKDVPCMDCGNRYPYYVMDFDHRNPKEKEFKIAQMVNSGNLSKVKSEIKKCDVVCANCHRIRTHC